ncbi:MAG: helix-hairpin-helix domain-containing protein [Deltaproteobacteria bacterium]|nr:helix-hairpin-helix domain-containing protein [Deltaproteobacteria bacterium]
MYPSFLKAFLSLFVLTLSYLVPFFVHPFGQDFKLKKESNPWVNLLQSSPLLSEERAEEINSLSAPARLSLGEKIKLNQATVKDLGYLPGIGEKTAEKIIAERQRVGAFKKLEDLMHIKGIKEKKFAKIKPQLEL